jgi:TetR/AcrR family transcriptional regulator, regulator of mycofactocin system
MSNSASPSDARVVRIGRQPATTHADISHTGLRLFVERGFDRVTVDDIAAACGIGRRTFFRYFPSKNDLPWGQFDDMLDGMREHLASLPRSLPLRDALRIAIVVFNHIPDNELQYHRERMSLLLTVPSLVAHSTIRYAAWRQVIAEFVGERLGIDPAGLKPQTIAFVCLGVSVAAYEQWLAHEEASLSDLLDEGFLTTRDLMLLDEPRQA